MVDKLFPYVSIFKNLILRNHWRSNEVIHKLTMPILFIIADRDELVPPQMSDELFKRAVNSEHKVRVEVIFTLVCYQRRRS